MKRIFVSLPEGVWKILKRDYINKMAETESEVIRHIVISFLAEHGYFVNEKGYEDLGELKDKVEVTEGLIESLIETLEEKGSLTFNEVDRKMKKKIMQMSK